MEKNYEEYITSKQFAQNCFMKLLSDGKPHAYKEIVAYINKTRIEENRPEVHSLLNNAVSFIMPLVDDENSPYTHIRHGWYQMTVQPSIARWTHILDKATELQCLIQIETNMTLNILSNNDRQEFEHMISLEYDTTDLLIDYISVCLAKLEDIDNDINEDGVPTIQI